MVKIKGYIVALMALRLCSDKRDLCEKWIMTTPLPTYIPPGEKDHLCIYIIRSINYIPIPELQAKLIVYVLTFMLQSIEMMKYYSDYEARIHVVGGSADECEVYAHQALKEIRHPLECWPTDVFEEFRMMFGDLKDWESMRVFLDKDSE